MKRFAMKRFAIFLLLILSFSATTFAQTKVNSGKNFVTYSYDNWDKAAEDYIALCEEYGFKYLCFWDYIDFSKQKCFTVIPGKWSFYIIRWVNDGMRASLAVISPEGRQSEIGGCSDASVYSITGLLRYSNSARPPKEYTDNLKLRYSFLGEPIP
jgi:hypothetical protein